MLRLGRLHYVGRAAAGAARRGPVGAVVQGFRLLSPAVTARRLIGILLAINALLLGVGAVIVPSSAREQGKGVHVGLVFDIGGKNDKSFNEAAWRGLMRAQAELGVETRFIEPTEGSDRESALRTLATKKFDLIIGVGFIFGPDLERLARQFPDVKFAGIDYSPSEGVGTLPNLAGLRFREHEGSFLVGAIAGLVTRTKVVGFVGGMKIPLIHKFEVGYAAGVHRVCPACRVVAAYAGTEPKAFADPSLGQELAAAQYGQGADIIFHASGKTGDGVFAAARQRGARAIGVDSDQFDAAPCCVVTSMVKRVDVAVVDIVKDVIAGKFRGGIHELGLAEHGVGFVADERNRSMLPIDVVEKVNALAEQIIAGKIRVPSE
ncbi:MAG: BMP family ABC transporter substrate-binding protein [Deltaproteobacteria bacterium]|nr:MAG: BMP family ABC transporter substrate-binding protein [Deltaproteobacteria bacterium]